MNNSSRPIWRNHVCQGPPISTLIGTTANFQNWSLLPGSTCQLQLPASPVSSCSAQLVSRMQIDEAASLAKMLRNCCSWHTTLAFLISATNCRLHWTLNSELWTLIRLVILPYLTLPSGWMTPSAKPALRPPSGPIAHPRKAKGYKSLPKALTSLGVRTKKERPR